MGNTFQEFFQGHERYFDALAIQFSAIKQHPAYETLLRSSAIAHKMKAEFSAMSLYYRTIAIPEATKLVDDLREGYQKSTLKGDYPELDQFGVFEDSFRSVMREALMSGYISISHKIENLVDFVNNHSEGKPFASMKSPKHQIVNYIKVLEQDFGLQFGKLVENENRTKIEHVLNVITPRIHRIRVTANRVKHQGGYPKHKDDIIINYFKEFNLYGSDVEFHLYRIPFSVSEFLIDLTYAEKYIDKVLELVNNIHIYAIIKKIISGPVTKGQEESRFALEHEQLPAYHNYIKHLVQSILSTKLDIHLAQEDRLPHPATFLPSKN